MLEAPAYGHFFFTWRPFVRVRFRTATWIQVHSSPNWEPLLPTHGFSVDCIARLRNGDRAGLLEARLETLIAGERKFMAERNVKLPTERTAATIADSETSDEE